MAKIKKSQVITNINDRYIEATQSQETNTYGNLGEKVYKAIKKQDYTGEKLVGKCSFDTIIKFIRDRFVEASGTTDTITYGNIADLIANAIGGGSTPGGNDNYHDFNEPITLFNGSVAVQNVGDEVAPMYVIMCTADYNKVKLVNVSSRLSVKIDGVEYYPSNEEYSKFPIIDLSSEHMPNTFGNIDFGLGLNNITGYGKYEYSNKFPFFGMIEASEGGGSMIGLYITDTSIISTTEEHQIIIKLLGDCVVDNTVVPTGYYLASSETELPNKMTIERDKIYHIESEFGSGNYYAEMYNSGGKTGGVIRLCKYNIDRNTPENSTTIISETIGTYDESGNIYKLDRDILVKNYEGRQLDDVGDLNLIGMSKIQVTKPNTVDELWSVPKVESMIPASDAGTHPVTIGTSFNNTEYIGYGIYTIPTFPKNSAEFEKTLLDAKEIEFTFGYEDDIHTYKLSTDMLYKVSINGNTLYYLGYADQLAWQLILQKDGQDCRDRNERRSKYIEYLATGNPDTPIIITEEQRDCLRVSDNEDLCVEFQVSTDGIAVRFTNSKAPSYTEEELGALKYSMCEMKFIF